MTPAEHKVKEVYPDAWYKISYNEKGIAIGIYIKRWVRILGFIIPIMAIYMGHGYTEQSAWENASKKLEDKK